MGTLLTPDRPTFRAVVAQVAAAAKAKLPEAVNGRVESAVKLVLAHDVTFLEDGTVEVGSSTDPLKTYILAGQACDCQDFAYGQAPGGWCQHRIAAGIAKRVQEQFDAQASQEPQAVREHVCDQDNVQAPVPEVLTKCKNLPTPLPEAPASVNVRVTIQGRECQITLRDTDEGRLLTRLQTLLQQFPAPEKTPRQDQTQAQDWCSIHEVQMRWNAGKDGRKGWHSHKTADGQWCKGKARR